MATLPLNAHFSQIKGMPAPNHREISSLLYSSCRWTIRHYGSVYMWAFDAKIFLLLLCCLLCHLVSDPAQTPPVGTKWHLVCRDAKDELDIMSRPGLPPMAQHCAPVGLVSPGRACSETERADQIPPCWADNEEFWDQLRLSESPTFTQNGVWGTSLQERHHTPPE